MTLFVTVKRSPAGYQKDILVQQSNGNADVRLLDGESADFLVHSTNRLTISEVEPLPAPTPEDTGASPQGGGGPGQVDPPV